MRDFKFRVWDILNKKMRMWGDIFHLPAWEIFPGTPEQRPFQVMQYTGIKEKMGKGIYEGDIIKITALVPKIKEYNNKIATVIFAECSFRLNFVNDSIPLLSEFLEYEVIGNIYENKNFGK